MGDIYLFSTPLLLLLLTIATCDDLFERRIPNTVVLWGIVLALGLGGVGSGHIGFLTALAGLVLGGALLLPFYLLGGMAAGDVKLMAMVGAFLGPAATLLAVMVTLAAGLVLGLSILVLWALLHSNLGLVVIGALRRRLPRPLRPAYPGTRPTHIPYAVAIAFGSMTAAWWPALAAATGAS